jgi:hypothetical protein
MIGLVHFAAEWWYTLERNNQMCQVFMISKSGYHAWLKNGPSKR